MPNRSGRESPRRSERSRSGPRRMPNKLFVGNLAKGTSKLELEREFSRFGRLADIWVSHVPPGFAFIEYFSNKDASDCVQALDGRAVLSQRLRVEFAKAEPSDRPVRRKKNPPDVSSSHRSRSPFDGSVGSRPRLLPPPKIGLPVVGPISSRRSPSPMLLLRRGGTGYEDVGSLGSTWSSASLIPTAMPPKSRSPHVRSPALPIPPTSHRDSLSSSGRLLAPPPPSTAALFELAGGYASVPADYVPTYGKHYSSSSSNHMRSLIRARSRSPLPVHSRTAVRVGSRDHSRVESRSHSRSPPIYRPKLLGRTPPLPSPSPPRRYRQVSRPISSDRDSPRHQRMRSPSPYSHEPVMAAYGSMSPSPPRQRLDLYQSSAATASAVARWSRSRSGSRTPVKKRIKGQPMTPPAAYRLSRSPQRSGSTSASSSRGDSRSASPRRSLTPHIASRISTAKYANRSQRNDSPMSPSARASLKYPRNEVVSSHRVVESPPRPPQVMKPWSPVPRKSDRSANRHRSPSPDARPRNGGSQSTAVPVRGSPTYQSTSRRH